MPPSKRRRSTKQASGPGSILVLLLIAAFLIYTYFEEQQNEPQPGTVATATQAARPTAGALPTRAQPTAGALPTRPPADNQGDQAGQGSLAVFFSDPLSGQESGGPDEPLIAAINAAQRTIDLAVYNLSLPNLADALIAAQQRGVQVRLVMESEAMERSVPTRLAEAGIPIVGDQREGLMHNKFTVIDGQTTFTGSMNYTAASAYKDFNNLVRIQSPAVAEAYTAEFEEMFTDGEFGPHDPSALSPDMTVAGIPVELYFSPDDDPAEQIIDELSQAQESIDFLAYSFTSDPIADMITARAKSGVAVRGVFDDSQNQSNRGGEYERLQRSGLDVHIDGIPGLLHDKVFIIDGQTVITGSYNFSASAENNNDENVFIIHDPAVAAAFQLHFQQVYESAMQ